MELDGYITNYKKSLSRNERNDELAFKQKRNVNHNIQEMYFSSAIVEAPKETKSNDEHVSISPIQAEKQGDNAGGSRGLSSSSGFGSSSSDSNSESFSAYGSNTGHSSRN